MDEVVAVIETDKVTVDVRSDHAGVIIEQLAAVDDTLEVGAPLFVVDTDAAPTAQSSQEPKATDTTSTPEPAPTAAPTASTPATPPSPGAPAAPAAPAAPTPSAPPTPPAASAPVALSGGGNRSENRVSMSRMRLRIAERLKEAQTNAACLTTFNEIDMSALMSMRSQYKDVFLEKHGIKLGFMSAFVKASVSALEEQPAVNAYIEGKEIVYHNYCDVSVAVASPTGLVVPVIRNAESLSFAGIEKEIMNYAKKAKDGSLTINEMTGGTFTISNGGVFGSLMGTPILNPPQSAILGMHGVFERPVAVKGNIEIRPMMYVALTYDHRIIDGREAVLFLRRIKDCVEDPRRMLLDV